MGKRYFSPMPVSKHALIRYKTIDKCLQNRFRKWSLEDLVEACAEALYEYEGVGGVSKRTVQLDLQNMRSDKLGYNAPIVVVDKRFYTYEEKDYSITNIPLSEGDLGTMKEVLNVLKQFKGFGYFREMQEMVSKLEGKILSSNGEQREIIELETNHRLPGLEWIDPLVKAVQKKAVLDIHYQSFKAKIPSVMQVNPYKLKEFRNRWFLLCAIHGEEKEMILALDRMKYVYENPRLPYQDAFFDVTDYFKPCVGVTRLLKDKPEPVVFRVSNRHAPYIISKPIHDSQETLEEDERGATISLHVIHNFELEKELLSYGDGITVLSPRRLRKTIEKRLRIGAEHYEKITQKNSNGQNK
jgi:predicted DNA-binding transcriptional regulator YafY